MNKLPAQIIQFISSQFVFSLATSKNNHPYSANCYYVPSLSNDELIFASNPKTNHAKQFIENKYVSATISLCTDNVKKIKGLQITGEITLIEGDDLENAKEIYIQKFPIAKDMELNLWGLKYTFIKMTDNSKGFGKKLIWQQ
jgi:uncharacterized protein YhbP (UPF0306 family)